MSLVVPGVGTEGGPQYAEEINNSLSIIDAHSHLPGSGVPITSDSLNIDGDVAMNGFNLTSARSIRLDAQDTPLAEPLDLTCVYVSGVDLYYNDANGTPVRITQDGAVAGTPGSIANLVSPASASYVSANDSFVWESDVNTPAAMDNGPVTIRNIDPSSNGITLQPPTPLAADFTLTLPVPPAATSFLTMTNTGVMNANVAVSQGITLSMLALALQQAFCPTGSILAFGGDSAPAGFLLCQGSAVSRTTYATLFALVGTRFGEGDGSTTFNLPDFRGQFLRGVTGASVKDPDAASRTAMATGGATGNNVGSIQNYQIQSHVHPTTGTGLAESGNNNFGYATGTESQVNTDATGGNETRPTNAYVNFIIKT